MKTKRKNHITVTIILMLMFVLFSVRLAIAEEASSISLPESAIVKSVKKDQANSNIDGHANKRETKEAKSVRDTCEYKNDDSSVVQIAQLIPYEIFNGDYAGMIAKYFNAGTC